MSKHRNKKKGGKRRDSEWKFLNSELRFILNTPSECYKHIHGFFTNLRVTACPSLTVSPLHEGCFDTLSQIISCTSQYVLTLNPDSFTEVSVFRDKLNDTLLVMNDFLRRRLAIPFAKVKTPRHKRLLHQNQKDVGLRQMFVAHLLGREQHEEAISACQANEQYPLKIEINPWTPVLVSFEGEEKVKVSAKSTKFLNIPKMDWAFQNDKVALSSEKEHNAKISEQVYNFVDKLGRSFVTLSDDPQDEDENGLTESFFVYPDEFITPAEQVHQHFLNVDSYLLIAKQLPTGNTIVMYKLDAEHMLTVILK